MSNHHGRNQLFVVNQKTQYVCNTLEITLSPLLFTKKRHIHALSTTTAKPLRENGNLFRIQTLISKQKQNYFRFSFKF